MTDDRDPALDALLRTHLHATPPQAVDAAILTAAHRAVEAPPRARSARATYAWRWWMPLAAAAVIGVVVIGILPVAPTLLEPATSGVSDLPVGGSSPSTSTSKSSVEPQVARGELPMTSKGIEPPNAPAPQLGAARERPERDATTARSLEANAAAAKRTVAPTPAAAPAPAPAADANASAAASRPDARLADRPARPATRTATVDEWIARIRTLRNGGRMADAAHALSEFRAAFSDADTRLPPDLREWAKTVR